MAEGGTRLTRLDPPSADNIILSDLHFLDCPICLEQIRQPRSLPCHHSFCEECLTSYIMNEVSRKSGATASFICPVCRKLTHPVNQSEDRENWAKQFPSDNVVIEMIQRKNKMAEPYYCLPCQRKGNTTAAQFWCKTNQSVFCKPCKEDFHDMIHINCDVVDITGSNHSLLEQSDKMCEKHKEKMDFYCGDHKSICCSKCITVGHRRCEDVTTTEDYCEKLIDSNQLEEIKKSLQQGKEAMQSLVNDFGLRLQSIADDRDTAMENIEDQYEQIEKRIAEMKKGITDELISKYKEERECLTLSCQKCERLGVAIQNTLELSSTNRQRNDCMDTIRLYQRGQSEVESCRDLIDQMLKPISHVSIQHEGLVDLTSLGETLNLGKIVVRKQQLDRRGLTRPLSECGVRELRKVNIKCSCDMTDCCARGVVYLPNGRIVVGDNNNKKIKLIDPEGDVVDVMKVNERPYGICMVDNTTVACVDGIGTISILTVASNKLTLNSKINTGNVRYGIAYRDGEFIVSSDNNVLSVAKDGATRMLQDSSHTVFAVSYDSKHQLLYTTHYTANHGTLAVGKLSADNRHADVLKVGLVKCPYGVDVDKEGNVYVCGYQSQNVIQMSADGTNVRELLTAKDGITNPEAISIYDDKLAITDISVSQCNKITVFQLV